MVAAEISVINILKPWQTKSKLNAFTSSGEKIIHLFIENIFSHFGPQEVESRDSRTHQHLMPLVSLV